MKQFYETYKDFPNLATVWREIRWSVRELERQINSSCYERVMLSNTKLAPKVGELPQDITDAFKDTYVLELLNLPDIHK